MRRESDPPRARYPLARHLLCILPALSIAIAIAARFGEQADMAARFQRWREADPALAGAMQFFSDYGNLPLYALYAILFAIGLRRRDGGLVCFVSRYVLTLLATLLIVEILKAALGRPRPLVPGGWTPFTLERQHQSFPSGHVAETSISALPLALRYGRVLLPFLLGLWPAVMTFSRIFLGQHHPTDTLASAGVASFVAAGVWFRRAEKKGADRASAPCD